MKWHRWTFTMNKIPSENICTDWPKWLSARESAKYIKLHIHTPYSAHSQFYVRHKTTLVDSTPTKKCVKMSVLVIFSHLFSNSVIVFVVALIQLKCIESHNTLCNYDNFFRCCCSLASFVVLLHVHCKCIFFDAMFHDGGRFFNVFHFPLLHSAVHHAISVKCVYFHVNGRNDQFIRNSFFHLSIQLLFFVDRIFRFCSLTKCSA